MDKNPILYSDLIKEDNGIKNAITQLTELQNAYTEMLNLVKNNAISMKASVEQVNVTTKSGRKEVEEMTLAAKKLKRAYDELEVAQSEVGAEIINVKYQTQQLNTAYKNEAALVNAASDSYEKMAAELKILVGQYKKLSTEEALNSKQGQELLNRIIQIKTELKKLDETLKVNIQKAKQVREQVSAEEKARQQLVYAMSDQNKNLQALNRQVKEANQIAKLQATIASETEGSYNRLSAQYALNKIQLNKMSQAERESTEAGKLLEKQTYEIYQQMIKLQEATGVHSLSVGNYKKAWDGLGVSINQVIREVPAAAISLNTFFLGISNNIPLVIDEIKRLREQNKLLATEGKQQISITKSIIASIVSWHTLLIASLTILAMHGEAIIDWTKSLVKGKDNVVTAEEALTNINEELKKGTGDYGQQVTKLKALSDEWNDLGDNLQKQKEFIKDNESAFEDLGVQINNVNDASNLLVNNTDAFIRALQLRAKASAAMKLAAESYEKALVAQNEAETKSKKGPDWYDKALGTLILDPSWMPGSQANKTGQSRGEIIKDAEIKRLENLAEALEATGDSYFKLYSELEKQADDALAEAGIDKYTKETKKKEKTLRDMSQRIYRDNVSLRKKYEESLTALEKDEYAKRRKAAFETYNTQTDTLLLKYDENKKILENEGKLYKKLTDDERATIEESQRLILNTVEAYGLKLKDERERIAKEEQIAELEIFKETLELKLQATRENSDEYLRLRLQLINTEKKIALRQNELKPVKYRQSASDIEAGFSTQSSGAVADTALAQFDQLQALQEAEFNIIRKSEAWKTKFKLAQEKDRLEKILSLNKAGLLAMSDIEIDTIKATIKGIDNQLREISMEESILERLGFDDKQIKALEDATQIVVDQFSKILDAQVELAEKEKEIADQRVEAAQRALDAELEARNNGYANSVSTARKELENEKRNQQKKEQMLAAAQARQERLDSLTQTSSLITASANLWSSFSSIPLVGPALAIAAIASMWTSFAVAKVKARQASGVTQEYGEGGFEIVEGGSHASGNDVDLGVKNSKGKRMVVEGNEGIAVINKRSTRKYKKILPEVMKSINKGTFEDKYLNAFNDKVDDQVILGQVGVTNVDMSRVEKGINKLIEQNDEKMFVDGQGRTIIKRKGLTKIIKS